MEGGFLNKGKSSLSLEDHGIILRQSEGDVIIDKVLSNCKADLQSGDTILVSRGRGTLLAQFVLCLSIPLSPTRSLHCVRDGRGATHTLMERDRALLCWGGGAAGYMQRYRGT